MKKILLGLGLLLNSAWALDVPAHHGYVTDQAGILSTSEEQWLTDKIKKIESETTVELAVLTIDSTEGESISSFTTKVGESWGVGKDDVDNGVLLTISVKDRKWFIATGYGVEGVIPDIIATRVGERNFPSYFRNGQYFSGISRGIDDIGGLLKADPSVVSSYEKSGTNQQAPPIIWVVIICFIVGLITAVLSKEKEYMFVRNIFILGIIIFFLGVLFFIGSEVISGVIAYVYGFIFASGGGGNGGINRFTGGFGASSGGGFRGFSGGSFGGGGGGGSW